MHQQIGVTSKNPKAQNFKGVNPVDPNTCLKQGSNVPSLYWVGWL